VVVPELPDTPELPVIPAPELLPVMAPPEVPVIPDPELLVLPEPLDPPDEVVEPPELPLPLLPVGKLFWPEDEQAAAPISGQAPSTRAHVRFFRIILGSLLAAPNGRVHANASETGPARPA
jgi:hypothetical protein